MINRLADLLPTTNTFCYAWAFLSNHAHFLFRSGDAELSTLMRRLLSGLNRYKYCGHSILMGRRKCEWQDDKYVHSYFGRSLSKGRESYYSYIKEFFCFRAVRELGIYGTEMAKRLKMSQPGVVYAVKKGESIFKDKDIQLIE